MSEWKTVRVRAGLLADVKARAGAEGSNATAWIERALGAALESADGRSESASRVGREQATPDTPAPRRAPLKRAADVTRNDAALRRQTKLNAAKERS